VAGDPNALQPERDTYLWLLATVTEALLDVTLGDVRREEGR
jgi:hypothetical protein